MKNPTGASAQKRFRIGFSFAGEKRDFVGKTARILADQFGLEKILYDKFHKAEFAQANLAFDLPKLYHNDTDLIVVVFCPDYEKKEWCGLEWRAIYDLIKKGTSKPIMLMRFGHADGDGLYSLPGYIELEEETPDSAAALILERLAINEDKRRDFYTRRLQATIITPTISIRHNLPALQPFYGRDDEREKIAEALDPESRTWGALIDGPGGMGKTSLAVRAAYDVAPGAFDEIVFVTLKSRELDDDGVRDMSGFLISGLAELLNELSEKLGLPDIAKAQEDKRPRLLLDALNGKRALLVLDNLESLTKLERDTVFTFVKRLPQGCKAILTSRGRIGSAAEELILDALSETAAMETLAKLAKNNTALAKTTLEQRLQLYRETGGKPLLLRWTAGQIGRGSCVTIADAIAYLHSCPEGNDPLEFIFGDLVDNFSKEETQALCALAYFTLPAKIAHIATIAECPEAEINKTLRILTNRSLVVPSEELDNFTLVPLVADFLQRKKPEVMTETGSRLEKQAYALVVENGYQKYDRFPILEAAWPMIAAALPLFLVGRNTYLQAVCTACEDFLDFTGRWDEWLSLSHEAEQRAIALGDWNNAGWRAHQAGWVYQLRLQSAEVLACAERAEAYWQKVQKGDRERATAIHLRGIGHEIAKNYPAAIAAYQEAVAIDRRINPESEDVAICLNALANVEQLSGNYAAAEHDYLEALRIAKLIGHTEMLAGIPGNLASLIMDQEKWVDAEVLAREAWKLSEKLGRVELIALGNYRLAKALVRQGKKAEALPYAERAVELFSRLGHPGIVNAQAILDECQA